MRQVLWPWFHGFEDRRNYWVYLFGRTKPGVSLAQAAAGLNKVYKPLINEVEAPLQKGMSEATLAKFKAKEVKVKDGRRGQSQIHEDARTARTGPWKWACGSRSAPAAGSCSRSCSPNRCC
jgi:hypothetical protein